MMEKVYLEDYRKGEKFVSPGRTMTEADIVNFASLTGDWHPIHTNLEYAKQTQFGERIAHGMLTLCLGGALLLRLGEHVTLPQKFIAFYGMESVRFLTPVKIGDTIRCEAEVVALEAKDDQRGLITYRNIIKNQRDEDAAVFTTKILAARRPAQ